MDWMKQVGGLLDQYAGGGNDRPGEAEQHFDQVSQVAPKGDLLNGLASAFRSGATPPFPELVMNLFSHADSGQKAGLLNTLIGALGPALLPQVLGQLGLGNLQGLFSGGQVSPDQADQVPPHAVGEMAARAEQQDNSVIERVAGLFADQPGLVKGLGSSVVGSVLSGLTGKRAA